MPTAKQIDAILPQTQCGLCGYQGCKPYAEALSQGNAAINLCPPGGVEGLRAIAQLMNADPGPYLDEMRQKAKPTLTAVIREAECIGCTKCIQACPVDAILGSAKTMHSVISAECTGCELCVAPCPVDCIDMVLTPDPPPLAKSSQYRNRYLAREKRLEQAGTEAADLHAEKIHRVKKSFIQEALLRAKSKKLQP